MTIFRSEAASASKDFGASVTFAFVYDKANQPQSKGRKFGSA
jgi:hypothetical protein